MSQRIRRSADTTGPAPPAPVLRSLRIGLCTLAIAAGLTAGTSLAPALALAAFEPSEANPGGTATTHKSRNRNAFSQPSANIPFDRLSNFTLGNALFRKLWVPAPSSTKSSDGLGPLFNARSCQICHLKDGRGHPPSGNRPADNAVSMFLRLSIPPETDPQRTALATGRIAVAPEPTYGSQLQDFAVTGLSAEGNMHIEYTEREVTLNGGTTARLRAPRYSITDLAYGPLHPGTMLSPRVAPPMIGLGLLEAVPEEQILTLADPEDRDRDGISGRASLVWDDAAGALRLGRFGWKAGTPSVLQQSAHAFAGDIGISSPADPRPWGECTQAQEACRGAVHGDNDGKGHEITSTMLELVVFYARNLAVPARPDAAEPDVLAGKKLFHDSGCAACHNPRFTTAERADLPEQSRQTIWPYTDLLLHDMGEGLADHRPEGLANGREWRTPPLWGLGLTETVSGHSFLLHDGRARGVLEAILWHGGEADAARQRVVDMTEGERALLLRFLNSL